MKEQKTFRNVAEVRDHFEPPMGSMSWLDLLKAARKTGEQTPGALPKPAPAPPVKTKGRKKGR